MAFRPNGLFAADWRRAGACLCLTTDGLGCTFPEILGAHQRFPGERIAGGADHPARRSRRCSVRLV